MRGRSLAKRLAGAVLLLPVVHAHAVVRVVEDKHSITLDNGRLAARVSRTSGDLLGLRLHGVELLGGKTGYWSWVGSADEEGLLSPAPGGQARLRQDPGGQPGRRGEVAVRRTVGTLPMEVEVRYALEDEADELALTALFRHGPGMAAVDIGEGRFALKLDGARFDYLAVDETRHGPMPSGADWDRGERLNLPEVRRIATGPFAGKAEHKYSYSAVLADTPAYGWASSVDRIGVWLINPSIETLAGGPTKVELTGHLDVNPGGAPTLLNMWLGSHYGGSGLSLEAGEVWQKRVGPFFLHLNRGQEPEALWRAAQKRAAELRAAWPFAWAAEPDEPPRGSVRGRLALKDPFDPLAAGGRAWVGLAAPGVNWQREGKTAQYWTEMPSVEGDFTLPSVPPGAYSLHAFADGIWGEFTRTGVVVKAGQALDLGSQEWVPTREGRTVWQLGRADRTAAEFRHGDDYWQWGRYLEYARDFPNGVDFTIGVSDPARDWNYCQPPRIGRRGEARSSEQHIRFTLPRVPAKPMTLRLALCGAREGAEVRVKINGQEAGRTGVFKNNSVMHRDGIRGVLLERVVRLEPAWLKTGENILTLRLQAELWHQGVLYDAIRLEAAPEFRVALAGDSTVCDYPAASASRGWGQYLGDRLLPEVQVLNFARSGRSTRTFIAEGHWQKLLAARPHAVLLQFGHNDSHDPARPEATDAAGEFRDHLRRMIREARGLGAEPVLVTPMHRRVFHEDGSLQDILAPYAAAMRELGAETGAPVVDLHRASGELLLALGEAESMRRHANAAKDRTHFNAEGAKAMADLVVRDLPSALPSLKPWMRE